MFAGHSEASSRWGGAAGSNDLRGEPPARPATPLLLLLFAIIQRDTSAAPTCHPPVPYATASPSSSSSNSILSSSIVHHHLVDAASRSCMPCPVAPCARAYWHAVGEQEAACQRRHWPIPQSASHLSCCAGQIHHAWMRQVCSCQSQMLPKLPTRSFACITPVSPTPQRHHTSRH
jgi:hypothetical protein